MLSTEGYLSEGHDLVFCSPVLFSALMPLGPLYLPPMASQTVPHGRRVHDPTRAWPRAYDEARNTPRASPNPAVAVKCPKFHQDFTAPDERASRR